MFRWGDDPDCASTDVQLLQLLRPELDRPDHDLHTYLLVEALDASGDKSSAVAALQNHWELSGATPLVTLAVGDRLFRRGAYRQALRMYRRLFEAELRGIRSHGQVVLDAATAAARSGQQELAEQLLERAAQHADTHERASERLAALPGRTTVRPPPLAGGHTTDDPAPADRRSDAGALPPLRAPLPSLPQSQSADEERLLDALRAGSFEAGEALVERLSPHGIERSGEILQVRRHQAALRAGDLEVLANLRRAAQDDHALSYARAVDHVIAAFDADRTPISPPALADVPAQPHANARLLLGPIEGTINEALAIVCRAGLFRRDLTSYNLTGTDRVPAGNATVASQLYAQLTRLIDLGGVRLFRRSRQRDRFTFGVALLSPLAAIISGRAFANTPALRYHLGCALCAATAPFALLEALDERDARDVVAALRSGFGRVGDGSVAQASAKQIRLAEDMWHLVSASDDRRLREIANDPDQMHYTLAQRHAARARYRAGLFAAGDIITAMTLLVEDVGVDIPRPLRSPVALHRLTEIPEAADLLSFALSPEYAQARWLST
ncbi:MAG TPA: hypothetical protein ENK23_01135 [Sorangium sp.]|nr:hypothetical protein [Sorangium sp.]